MATTRSKVARVSIEDVAAAAGVSKGTVSLALNKPADESPLSPETRQRVIRTATALNYRPDSRAQALARGRSRNVAMLYPGPVPRLLGVHEDIGESFTRTLQKRGYHLLFVRTDDSDSAWVDTLRDGRVDAAVCIGELPPRALAAAAAAELPMVLMNHEAPAKFTQINVDESHAMHTMIGHLTALGHRRIAYFGWTENPAHYSYQRRADLFQSHVTASGLGAHCRVDLSAPRDAIEHLLRTPKESRPTALIVYSHFEAVEVLSILAARGVSVPRDLSVACYNDVPPMDRLEPPVTVFAVPGRAIGELAAEELLKSLSSGESRPAFSVSVKGTIVPRASTAPAPRR